VSKLINDRRCYHEGKIKVRVANSGASTFAHRAKKEGKGGEAGVGALEIPETPPSPPLPPLRWRAGS